uniref:BTB domain-containing protein n=1 Tax=Rhizochromulina marina TaxID=1034831 RepID=A0A7S2W1Z2_9STRA|mmetsp:Transcript_11746/g.33909  ORF Transcript_11746/g.33909 Transcript_11746/m.33909 type:complete len:322 (+) Transcript_11746:226-1191(+)|eukprot:CAMPEP_0118965688 /NCGR_PEP_ID=MMETSP1173-20130426/3220_1 /TAXON_ID=1034831 /ORGANISM="Rhizochromulina marina cf, Strain CCMP1243" /LENGTH=321 /DNA_ID=CAMNT_0006914347 /DNA_START=226 /DNA_END=1191 /DNA_ORIENTATION=-
MANQRDRSQEQVEFTVKPEEDLILEGTERTITRVQAGTPYSCLMLKSQRFSSLFRHYAKHHGLRKDDLAFFFTEELQNDDTPESVFLQKNDEIIVRKRRKPQPEPHVCPDKAYFKHMRFLLDDSEHKDVTFVVGPCKDEVRAHKAILVARGDYFKGLFRKGSMRESETNTVAMEKHSVPTLERMLEFIYTNRVEGLKECSAHELLDLLSAAEEFLLPDLKSLCEHAAQSLINTENVAKMMSAAERFEAPLLQKACINYILGPEKNDVIDHPTFKQELESYPLMLFPIIKAAPTLSNSPPAKRQRTDVPALRASAFEMEPLT